MTGQVQLDSYADAGILVAVDLVNELAPGQVTSRRADEIVLVLGKILAVDPPSVAQLGKSHVPGFNALAQELREVFNDLRDGDVDAAAGRLNELLAKHPAHPHLAKEEGRWRLHHHPLDAALLPMWTSICAEGVARVLASDHAHRLGTCEDPECSRVYFDVSRNGSRRFCSTTCQNRIKAAAFRRRRSGKSGKR